MTRDAEPVQLAEGERLEDQEVERALQEVGACVRHRRLITYRHSIGAG